MEIPSWHGMSALHRGYFDWPGRATARLCFRDREKHDLVESRACHVVKAKPDEITLLEATVLELSQDRQLMAEVEETEHQGVREGRVLSSGIPAALTPAATSQAPWLLLQPNELVA